MGKPGGKDAAILHHAGGGEPRPHGDQSGRRADQGCFGNHRRRLRHFRRHLGQGRNVRRRRHRSGGIEGRSGNRLGEIPMKLFSFWRSLATYRVRIALNLKGITPDEVVDVNLMKGAQREAAYRAVNPMMAIPALVDGDGPALFESLAIIEYLDETHPNPPLLPKDPRGRARVRGLAQIVAADSHPLIVPRVREYLAEEFKINEANVTKWAQHWHRAALTGLEVQLQDKATGRYAHGDSITIA